jgi:hypothetical protein
LIEHWDEESVFRLAQPNGWQAFAYKITVRWIGFNGAGPTGTR